MFVPNTRSGSMRRLVLLFLPALILTGCAASSQPPMIVQPSKQPEPDARWMKTPELPPNCATWSECAQHDIQSWQESLTATGAI